MRSALLREMGAWAWVWVVAACLAGHAYAQLGEGVGGNATTISTGHATTSQDLPLQDDHGEEQEEEEVEVRGTVEVEPPQKWTPVEETYLGCLQEEDNFNGTLNFLNLTQRQEELDEPMTSLADGCFQFCLNKIPFSQYISVRPAVNGNVDACGCHNQDDLDPDNKVYDSDCESGRMNFFSIYCGPANEKCLNGALACLPSSLLILLLLLPLLLTS